MESGANVGLITVKVTRRRARGLWASPFFLQSPRPAKLSLAISPKRFLSRGGVPFLDEKWVARWRSSQDGGDEQMFGAK
jgi:hypothetical protein